MTDPVAIAAYLSLFVLIGVVFLLANLLVGRLLRPNLPNEEKLEIYECGEPTIGSSFVQFDLRFYVIALIFLVFDAEVAFFFPAATVYGKGTAITAPDYKILNKDGTALTPSATKLYRELGVEKPSEAIAVDEVMIRQDAASFALFALVAIMVFFWVLVIGFAYEWKTGALDWVRAVPEGPSEMIRRSPASLTDESLQIQSV